VALKWKAFFFQASGLEACQGKDTRMDRRWQESKGTAFANHTRSACARVIMIGTSQKSESLST